MTGSTLVWNIEKTNTHTERANPITPRKEHADRLLDESPAAYRRLSDVMQAQCDLVAIRDTLKTVLNYKSL